MHQIRKLRLVIQAAAAAAEKEEDEDQFFAKEGSLRNCFRISLIKIISTLLGKCGWNKSPNHLAQVS